MISIDKTHKHFYTTIVIRNYKVLILTECLMDHFLVSPHIFYTCIRYIMYIIYNDYAHI